MTQPTPRQLVDDTRQAATRLRALADDTTLTRGMGPHEAREFPEALRSIARQLDEVARRLDPAKPISPHTVQFYRQAWEGVVDARRLIPGETPAVVQDAEHAVKTLHAAAEALASTAGSDEPRPAKITRNMLHDLVGKRLGGTDLGGGAYAAPGYDQMGIAYDLHQRYDLIGSAVTRSLDDVPDEVFAEVAERHRVVDWPDGVRMTRAAREATGRRPRDSR